MVDCKELQTTIPVFAFLKGKLFFFFLKKSNLCFLKEPPLLLEYIGSGRQSSYGRLSVLYQGHLRGFTKEKVSQEDAFLFDNDLPPPLRCW